MTKSIMIVGVGGQGTLLTSRIIGNLLINEGYDVKLSEVHGMSQRGGSVSSEVRFGKSVASPMVPEGESDFLVILEETQIDNNIHKLREGGVLITPATVPLDKLAHPKALNTLMLGALAAHFDQPEEKWLEVLKENLPEKVHQLNVDMFRLGKDSK